MKKIILKLIIGLFILLNINTTFANIGNFDHENLSYDGTTLIAGNNSMVLDIYSMNCGTVGNNFSCMMTTTIGMYYVHQNGFNSVYTSNGDTNLYYDNVDELYFFKKLSGGNDLKHILYSSNYVPVMTGKSTANYNTADDLGSGVVYYNGVRVNVPVVVINRSCVDVTKTVENVFDFNYKNEYNITNEIIVSNDTKTYGVFQYEGDSNNFGVVLDNVEGLYGFTGSLYNAGLSSFVFSSLENPFSNNPKLLLTSDIYLDYFELKSTISGTGTVQTVYGINSKDEVINILPYLNDDSNFYFNQKYYFPNYDLVSLIFEFGKQFDDINLKTDFGKIVFTDELYEYCYDDETYDNGTLDGESYTGTIDEIGDLDLVVNSIINEGYDGTNSLYNDNGTLDIGFNEDSCNGGIYDGTFGGFYKFGCYVKNFLTGVIEGFKNVYNGFLTFFNIFNDFTDVEHKSLNSFFFNTASADNSNSQIMDIMVQGNFEDNKLLDNSFNLIKYILIFVAFLSVFFIFFNSNKNE